MAKWCNNIFEQLMTIMAHIVVNVANTGMANWGPKRVRWAPNGINLEIFQKLNETNVLKTDLKISGIFHLGPTGNILSPYLTSIEFHVWMCSIKIDSRIYTMLYLFHITMY